MTDTAFPYLSTHHWSIFSNNSHTALQCLAYQDSFIRWLTTQTTQLAKPFGLVHFYPITQPTILLGAKDSRLPQLNKGLQFLQDQGYQYALRPHGGLGVVCDHGILNIGIASNLSHFPLSIDAAYEQMVQLIQLSLTPYHVKVEAYEIPNSYCPGKYDLVVNQQKIGGIAQRRFKTGITTAAYLSVTGDQAHRAHTMSEFYRLSKADNQYPQVEPESMTTIESIIGKPLTVRAYQQRLIDLFDAYSTLEQGNYSHPSLHTIYDTMLPVAIKRTQALTDTN